MWQLIMMLILGDIAPYSKRLGITDLGELVPCQPQFHTVGDRVTTYTGCMLISLFMWTELNLRDVVAEMYRSLMK